MTNLEEAVVYVNTVSCVFPSISRYQPFLFREAAWDWVGPSAGEVDNGIDQDLLCFRISIWLQHYTIQRGLLGPYSLI